MQTSNFHFNNFQLFLEAEFHIKTKFIVADFSKGADIFDDIEKKIEDLPVGILGNFL